VSTIPEIEQAVSHLSSEDLVRFRQWFEEFDAAMWDTQFERDVKTGKLDKFAEQAIVDFRAGKFREL
jgi:hypothetical protein